MPARPADAAELLRYTELSEVRTYELRGRRVTAGTASEPTPDIAVKVSETSLETRMRLEVTTESAVLFSDMAVVYSLSEPLELAQDVVREFVERVGIMAVFPFVRESVFATAARLTVTPPVLGLLRAGSLSTGTMVEAQPSHFAATPAQLARELGVDAKAIRSWLRSAGATPDATGRWYLDNELADAVRRHFVGAGQ
jgi:hypothetical protein